MLRNYNYAVLKPHQKFLANLRGTIEGHPFEKTVFATCIELSEITGLEFGQNSEDWISWIVANKEIFYEMLRTYREKNSEQNPDK